jgi:hypothetical protein
VLHYRPTEAVVITSDFHLDRARYIFEREFAGTGVRLTFAAAETDEAAVEFDLAAQKIHERNALARLQAQDGVSGQTMPGERD